MNITRADFQKLRSLVRKEGNTDSRFGQAEARWDDPLYTCADLAARIACYQIGGRLLVKAETRYGPDYDGTPVTRYHEIPATFRHYCQWVQRMQEESEGVDNYAIVSWLSHENPEYWYKRGHALWEASLEQSFIRIIAA